MEPKRQFCDLPTSNEFRLVPYGRHYAEQTLFRSVGVMGAVRMTVPVIEEDGKLVRDIDVDRYAKDIGLAAKILYQRVVVPSRRLLFYPPRFSSSFGSARLIWDNIVASPMPTKAPLTRR